MSLSPCVEELNSEVKKLINVRTWTTVSSPVNVVYFPVFEFVHVLLDWDIIGLDIIMIMMWLYTITPINPTLMMSRACPFSQTSFMYSIIWLTVRYWQMILQVQIYHHNFQLLMIQNLTKENFLFSTAIFNSTLVQQIIPIGQHKLDPSSRHGGNIFFLRWRILGDAYT